jgi:hypothetical protein
MAGFEVTPEVVVLFGRFSKRVGDKESEFVIRRAGTPGDNANSIGGLYLMYMIIGRSSLLTKHKKRSGDESKRGLR